MLNAPGFRQGENAAARQFVCREKFPPALRSRRELPAFRLFAISVIQIRDAPAYEGTTEHRPPPTLSYLSDQQPHHEPTCTRGAAWPDAARRLMACVRARERRVACFASLPRRRAINTLCLCKQQKNVFAGSCSDASRACLQQASPRYLSSTFNIQGSELCGRPFGPLDLNCSANLF